MNLLIIIPIISFLFDLTLVTLNKKHQEQNKNKNTLFEQSDYENALNYGKEKSNNKLTYILFRQVYIIILFLGLGKSINIFTTSIFENIYLSNILTVFIMYSIFQLISSIYEGIDTFTTETKFGFNKSTTKKFIKDQLIDYIITAIILIIVTFVINYLYNSFELGFLIFGFIFVVILLVLYYSLFVVIFMPLMFKMTPIENDELSSKISNIAKKEGFTIDDIVVINASEKTTKINAYFSGITKHKKVMLFDTLFDKFTDNQLIAILAHEIGHSKHKHMIIDLFIDGFISLIYFSLFYLISISQYQVDGLNPFISNIIIFTLIYELLNKLIKGIKFYYSRKQEKQADLYVKEKGYGEDLIFGLSMAAKTNNGNLYPHPLFVLFKYDHPPYYDRIDYLKKDVN